MTTPNNILQQVQTYQKSDLALLQNMYFFIAKSNKRYKNFQNTPANLGDTVLFDTPPRFTTTNSLVADWQSAVQKVQTLTVNKQLSSAFQFTSQEYVFNNIEEYSKVFGRSAMAEVGAQIESDVASVCVTAPYRFYGNGVTAINSFQQLAEALTMYRTFGAPKTDTIGIIPDVAYPAIVNSGLSQFVTGRNEELANSWELGKFSQCDWNQSNLLPVHIAGTEGQQGSVLTVVSVSYDATGAVTAITFSGTNATNDPNSVQQYDRFQFSDNVSGFNNIRFLTYIGHKPSAAPVQFQATAQAASTGGSQVTVSINPPLQANATKDQNLTAAILPGMQCTVVPSHRAGAIWAGNPMYLAMPQLPMQRPYDCANTMDMDSGASIRRTEGAVLGQNQMGMIYDAIYGYTLVDDYAMSVIFPLV